ncbi:MBL fold metallo-hydrolase [Kitasatospora atroaurantiaca]|uniref:Ribonuclease BN (tRNA processing enzyme) n=1 Tax=Kitasatospora atroaurantiaca TaxID=285545 RepID=A0A561EMG7_9ACTN|nr:MBL fold metallo-hydrolase [Kitasatospora atroaurantiaca]TWE16769.1 ribonuclease BN (tRNA processing enzyme) [Kitasatospora atroaurantiaca]
MRRLTVLGTCGGWPEAGRAASGFLLEYDGFRLVLDLGYATFPRLLEHCHGSDVDAVVVTHEHPDHCADLSALCRERYFAADRGPRVPLYCTPGVIERVQAMEPTEDLLDVFDVHRLPGAHRVGPFHLDAVPLPHHVPHAGVRVTAPGLTLAYSGDAGPDAALAELGAAADLFVIGATLQGPPPGDDPHHLMSALEAGTWATRAGARRLLLTHFWPGSDRALSVAEARSTFAGEVIAADEGRIVELG